MKNFLNSVGNFLLAVGEARYASWLARQGRIDEAKAIMTK
jgi:hypothetical protein